MASKNETESEIQQFYNGANVFVTGATGFIGQVLIEKILRSCSVNKMYLLVRPKKNTDPQDRLRKLFTVPVFKKLWEERPKFIDDVLLITGDCSEPGLGISAAHEKFMVDNIDIVIHCAATINFNGPLKQTVLINVRATRDLMIMAQRMHRLKSFVYVSTAFSNPNKPLIEEKIYKNHLPGDILIGMVENMSDSLLNSITAKCIAPWPNTYSFSKSVAENIVEQYGKNMPICITRPCVVIFTQDEPIPGWSSNLKNIPGLCMGIGLGAIHVVYLNSDSYGEIVPADKVANMIITSAWHASKTRSKPYIPVINYVPNNIAPHTTYGQLFRSIIRSIKKNKLNSVKEVWKPSVFITESNILYTILFFLFHYIPGFLVDVGIWSMGKKMRVTKMYQMLDVLQREMKFFGVNRFNFDNKNVIKLMSLQSRKDKTLFNMDLSDMKIDEYTKNCIIGFKQFILNEHDNSSDGYKRHKNIMMIYCALNTIVYGFLLYLIYGLSKLALS